MIANGSNEEIIAVADIGGTHARFALARVGPELVPEIGEPLVLRTADFPDLASAYDAFAAGLDGARPTRGSFALACPIRGETLKFTNNPWTLRPATLAQEIGARRSSPAQRFRRRGPCRRQGRSRQLHPCLRAGIAASGRRRGLDPGAGNGPRRRAGDQGRRHLSGRGDRGRPHRLRAARRLRGRAAGAPAREIRPCLGRAGDVRPGARRNLFRASGRAPRGARRPRLVGCRDLGNRRVRATGAAKVLRRPWSGRGRLRPRPRRRGRDPRRGPRAAHRLPAHAAMDSRRCSWPRGATGR